MCGIAGYVIKNQSETSKIMEMAESISHRGPDDEGFIFANLKDQTYHTYASGKSPEIIKNSFPVLKKSDIPPSHNLAMAQVRYSIIDLSPHGHQPMWSSCGKYCITFNGEIYNYIELRNTLKAAGRVFTTQSDTEVLLQAYMEWGENLFKKINGFFAFSLYDVHRQQVLLGRDRIGKAHLYVTHGPLSVYWASEIKSLIKSGQVNTQDVDKSSIADFIIYGRRDRMGTFWNEVIDFPPGHYAWVGLNTEFTPVKYWSLPNKRLKPNDISFAESVDGLRNLLVSALDMRLRADVPIGFELSGGLDSSALVGLAAGVLGKKINTYTIKFNESHSDEEPFARMVADRYPDLIKYTVITPPQDEFWNASNRFVWEQEEPFHSPNLYTSQSMQRIIKGHGAHVVISGAGGDEILAGYPNDYFPPYLGHLLYSGKIFDFIKALRSSTELNPMKSILLLVSDNLISEEMRARLRKRVTGEYQLLRDILPKHLFELSLDKKIHGQSSFHGRTVSNMSDRLMNYWLRSGMKSSYGVPIEPRSPFLDYRVVEFCTSLPPEYLINDGWQKYLLRKVVEPFLPAQVVWRRNKMGFPFPYREWLSLSKPLVIKNLITSDCPFVNKYYFQKNYDKLSVISPITLWKLVALILWWKRVVEGRCLNISPL